MQKVNWDRIYYIHEEIENYFLLKKLLKNRKENKETIKKTIDNLRKIREDIYYYGY
ncbi:MAG: hypothetical protein QG564_1848 [Campylobacterota bacterium]|nr:hypothetical protein [Campylobacterota bacterium]